MAVELVASHNQDRDKKPPSGPDKESKGDKPKSGGPEGFADAARKLEPHPGAAAIVRRLLDAGELDENTLANEAFWAGNEALRGQPLDRGSPDAQAWLRARDEVVRPTLKSVLRAKAAKPPAAEEKPGASKTETPVPTPPAVKGEGPSRDDTYYTQSGNSYDDAEAEWKGGSAAHNTCNMTALTMALVSMAGDEKVRQSMAALLRKKGYRAGAKVRAGKRTVTLAKALGDAKVLAEVQLEDLVTAAGVKSAGSYKGVTQLGTIAKIAKLSGIASGAKIAGDKEQDLWKPEVRAQTKAALESGKRIVAGTVNHYVYLTEVLEDGIIVHDPAGLRVSITGDSFIHPGTPEDKASSWVSRLKEPARQATALRRASKNDAVLTAMQRVQEVNGLKGKPKSEALAAWKKEGGGAVETGKGNFYGLDELKKYNCRVRIVLDPAEQAEGEEAQAAPAKQ